ncbi:MAG: hypothetical protein E7557_07305 [Ruminococcaceae bacterium]|nr:hypothetical protein [Oscillospiraceae bacterium]
MKVKIFLSAFVAIPFAIITHFICSKYYPENALASSIFAGLGMGLILFYYLLIHEKVMNKKYASAEKNLKSPVFYKTNGNFNLGLGKIKNGNIYFCEDGIAFISLDEKPHSYDEILIKDIDSIDFDNPKLNIFTKDNRIFLITIPDSENVISALREKGWL